MVEMDANGGMDEKESGGKRVMLLAGMAPARRRALALALAREGHSVILWAPGEATEGLVELQLEIHDAGGISLAHGGEGLDAPAEAFGRIDEAITDGLEAGRRCLAASGGLERRLRPGRAWIALGEGEAGGEGLGEAPPGVRVKVVPVTAGDEAGWAEAILKVVG